MHTCEMCDYQTSINYNLKKHLQSKKHLDNLEKNNNNNFYICQICNKKYSHQSSFSRHQKNCKYQEEVKHEIEIENLKKKYEIEKIRTEYEHKLEIQKIKYETEIKIKEAEKTYNTINNNIHNTINISKIEFLNTNFNNVIDIKTFIENYNNQYGLTDKQTQILLENYENDGINSCISSLVYYLKQSAIKQYKELIGKEISIDNIILPFLLSDKSLREHFEKSINGQWDKTTMIDNIKKIVNITNDQVYKHHNKFIGFNSSQRKRIINGVLKASGYSNLSQISIQDLYKLENSKEENSKEEVEEENENKID